MRNILLAAATVTAVLLFAAAGQEAAAQGDYYGGYTYGYGFGFAYGYRPACPYNYHYSCWLDPYGYRHCGCLRNDLYY